MLLPLGIVIGGVLDIGPALNAAHGQGVHGSWVARQQICSRGNCSWTGDFLLSNGTEARENVGYQGNLPSVHAGLRVPALDTGASGEVYPVKGTNQWIIDLACIIGGTGCLVVIGGWRWLSLARRPGHGRHEKDLRNGGTGVAGDGANDVYEARPGINARSLFLIALFILFCVLAVVTPMSLGLRIIVIGFFGLGGLLYAASLAYAMATRQVALRIDATGVTMRPRPLSATARFRPWEDIDTIVIWQFRRNPYLGIVPRPGAPSLLSRPSGYLSRVSTSYLAPDLPPETVQTSIPATMWRLRAERIAQAAHRFAPDVQVIDLRRRSGWAARWRSVFPR